MSRRDRRIAGLEPVSVVSVKDLVQEKLIQHMRAQRLSPKDKLPSESVLAYNLGVSRNAVREALRSLEAMGILEARTGAGWYVREPSLDAVTDALILGLELNGQRFADLNRLRIGLEAGFFAEAMRALTPADVDELERLADEMVQQARASAAAAELDYQFHQRLYSRIENPAFSRLLAVLWRVYMSAYPQPALDSDSLRDIEEHREIAAAIRAGDEERARRHLVVSLQGIEQIIAQLSDGAATQPAAGSQTCGRL